MGRCHLVPESEANHLPSSITLASSYVLPNLTSGTDLPHDGDGSIVQDQNRRKTRKHKKLTSSVAYFSLKKLGALKNTKNNMR